MKLWKNVVLFYLGGTAYMILEFAWRGWSHGSMFLLGGTCFLLLGKVGRRLWLPARLILSAGMVTALELLTGLLVNRNYEIWDYRALPFQFLGQISLIFSLLWIPVSFAGILLYDQAEKRI